MGHEETNLRPGRGSAAGAVRGVLLLVTCAAVLAMTACRSRTATAGDMSVREELLPSPARVGMASVTIHLANAQGEPVRSAHVHVEGDMAHPGMAPVFADAAENAPGTYQAAIDFNMPGDWVVLLHIHLADGRRIERQLNVKGVQAR